MKPDITDAEIVEELSKDNYFESITRMLALLTYATNILFVLALIMTAYRFF